MASESQSEREARIIAHARTSFGDAEKAGRWLRRPTLALHGKAPLDLLGTLAGADRVETLLARIEHGIAA
jgi:putative toxin-antitoxin system antitoxin component (TIGR02293 family)